MGTQGGSEGADRGNQSGPGRKFIRRKSLAPPKRFCNIAPWRQRGSLHPDLSSPIPVTEVAFGGISIRDKQGGFARVSSGFSVCQLFYFTFIAAKQAQDLPLHSLKFLIFIFLRPSHFISLAGLELTSNLLCPPMEGCEYRCKLTHPGCPASSSPPFCCHYCSFESGSLVAQAGLGLTM